MIVAFILIQLLTGKCITALRNKAAHFTDRRLKLLYDVVSGIRTIKEYGWELELEVSLTKLQRKVNAIRAKEARYLLVLNFIKSMMQHLLRYCGLLSALLVYYVKT